MCYCCSSEFSTPHLALKTEELSFKLYVTLMYLNSKSWWLVASTVDSRRQDMLFSERKMENAYKINISGVRLACVPIPDGHLREV